MVYACRYSMAIDMWSLGCILPELLTGIPLFPGEEENDQLACIMEVQGMPPRRLLEESKRSKAFFSSRGVPRYCSLISLADGRTELSGGYSAQGRFRGPPKSKDLSVALKGCKDPLFVDFLKRCLEFDPKLRLNPLEALRHSWLRPSGSTQVDKYCSTKVRQIPSSKSGPTTNDAEASRINEKQQEIAKKRTSAQVLKLQR